MTTNSPKIVSTMANQGRLQTTRRFLGREPPASGPPSDPEAKRDKDRAFHHATPTVGVDEHPTTQIIADPSGSGVPGRVRQ